MSDADVTFTAQLQDDMSAPLKQVERNVTATQDRIARAAEKSAKAQARAAELAAKYGQDVAAGHPKIVGAMDRVGEASKRMADKMEAARNGVSRSVSGMVKSARDHEQAWTRTGTAMMAAGGLLLAGVGLAVKTYADFDKQMSSVQAATHASEQDMGSFREAAIRAGADTAFSAKEAGQAIEELSKAGVSAKDVLGGGLAGSLSLAAAGNLDVAKSAEIAATALSIFKLGGDQTGHVADLLAAGAGKAQGSVEDMGMALKQGGLVASQYGLSVEDTTGAIAQLANAGLVGSDAGTSLKSMLLALGGPSEKASKLMGELGINLYDSSGKFIGLEATAGVLQDRLSGLTEEQRNQAMATIFGADAIRTANVLMADGATGVAKWRDAVNDAGYASLTAAQMQNNLAGDIEKLGGSIDTVFLKGGQGPAEVLRSWAQGAEKVVDWIGQIPAPVLATVTGLAGLGGAAAVAFGAFAVGLPKVVAFKDALGKLPDGVTGKLGAIAKGAGLVGAAFVAAEIGIAAFNASAAKSATLEDANAAVSGLAKNGDSLNQFFGNLKLNSDDKLSGQIHNVADALRAVNPEAGNWGQNLASFGATNLGVENGVKKINDALHQTDTSFQALATGGNIQQAGAAFSSFVKSSAGQVNSLQDANKYFPEYIQSLRNTAQQLGVTLNDTDLYAYAQGKIPPALAQAAAASKDTTAATQALAATQQAAATITDDQAKKLEQLGVTAQGTIGDLEAFTQSLINAGLVQQSENGAMRSYQAAIDDAGKAAQTAAGRVDVLKVNSQGAAVGFNITTEAGRAAAEKFDGLAGAGLRAAEAMAKNKASQAQVQQQLKSTFGDVIANAHAMGINGQAAVDLAKKTLGIPKNANIDTWMSKAAYDMAKSTGVAVDQVDGKKATVTVETRNITRNITIFENQNSSASIQQDQLLFGGQRALFASGGTIGNGYGTLPGWSPNVDNYTFRTGLPGMPFIGLGGGETVVRPEVTAAIGAGNFAAMNKAAISGGISGVERALPQVLSKTAAPRPVAASISRSPMNVGNIAVHLHTSGATFTHADARRAALEISNELELEQKRRY